jgi:ectoine hydroxylase-related dioxygenase (phytanoyl-CoA dioxygenase family)
VERGVLVYDSAQIRPLLSDDARRDAVMAELATAINDGPGVVVLAGAFDDAAVVDAVSDAFRRIIAEEKEHGTAPGDHFAEAGANDRVWNALEKLAVVDPSAFAHYYANDMLALVCEAWLGPRYQVTSQVNQVNPGGNAQSPHRDYHLGFQSQAAAESYPVHAHHMSAALTLQGAVAHGDMPLESGPTLLLPHSQKYGPGYIAWHLPEFKDYFQQHFVQLPLKKGDAVFFNPALFHAAGENTSADIQRMANLLQISSAFGRAMETIDRERVVNAIYPSLLEMKRGGMAPGLLAHAIAASAEGYAFPTNLDRDQPQGSDAPPAQADLVTRALEEEWEADRLAKELSEYATSRLSH